jgi:2-keto-4-pentenoate hydratase/2-oxohepta-3-ene-1,7-dioic acid hydratase in catechol pathway
MRISRVAVGSRTDFAMQADDGAWVPYSTLGIDAPDTATALRQGGVALARTQAGLGQRLSNVPLQCPIVRPGSIIAIGLNYMDHIRETAANVPERPVVFAKFSSALVGPHDPIIVDSRLTEQADYESELAVVIGSDARWVSEDRALESVFGYAVANDVSARDWQRTDGQLSRSKSFDTFCPIGPWITSADEVPDPQVLGIRSSVNGEIRQESSTAEMVFSVAQLIAFLSRTMTLRAGDVILTGTPHGVGMARKPPTYLVPGDVVRCEVDQLGAVENRVIGPTLEGEGD